MATGARDSTAWRRGQGGGLAFWLGTSMLVHGVLLPFIPFTGLAGVQGARGALEVSIADFPRNEAELAPPDADKATPERQTSTDATPSLMRTRPARTVARVAATEHAADGEAVPLEPSLQDSKPGVPENGVEGVQSVRGRASEPSATLSARPGYQVAYLDNPAPHYPYSSRLLGQEGRVVLRAEVLPDGTCGRLEVEQTSGHRLLDEAALDAVRQWHFVAGRDGDKAVPVWTDIPVSFTLSVKAV